MGIVTEGNKRLYACDNCGSTDCFAEVNKSVNESSIDYIDADTGSVEWTGETEYGDPDDHLHYVCTNCDKEFDESAFDPKERIAEALAGLEELL
jgi:protein-arginine kinase activator protein McsA